MVIGLAAFAGYLAGSQQGALGMAPSPLATRVSDATSVPARPPVPGRQLRQIAEDLEAKLTAYETVRAQEHSAATVAAKDELAQAAISALGDVEGQLNGTSTPLYWGAVVLRDGVASGDEAALELGRRYIASVLRQQRAEEK